MRWWPGHFPHPALVFVVVAWALNFNIIKIAIAELGPDVASLVRYLAMMVVLYFTCRALRISLKYPPGTQWRMLFAGLIANGVYMVCFVEGMKTAGAAQGAIVLATAPVWIAFFAILLKQDHFSKHLLIGGLLAFAGAVTSIVAGGGGLEGDKVGALLVLASAILWAWSVVLMRPLVVEGSPYAVFALSFPGGLIALLPYGLSSTIKTDWSSVSPAAWWSLAYLVFIAGVGAFAAYYKGLADVGPAKTSLTQFFIAPTAALSSWLIFGGRFVPLQAIGLGVVVLGTFIASGRASKLAVFNV